MFEPIVHPGELVLMLVHSDCKALQYFESGEELLLDETTHRIRHFVQTNDFIRSSDKGALAMPG